VGMIIAVAVRHRQPIVDERHVEFAGFENSRDLLVIPPTSNRRAIPDDAPMSSAGWCSSAPAGSRPSPFAVSCSSPCPRAF
jgi:hypothetical protein